MPTLSTPARSAIGLIAAALLAACGSSGDETGQPGESAAADAMHVSSTAFAPGATIPDEFTCTGAGTSPPLAWSEPPAGTKSFALTVEDPDAPGGVFRHWGVYDIPADRRELAAGAAIGVQTSNDFGKSGYGGPCPPPGDKPHRYAFRILALDVEHLPGAPADAAGIEAALDGHVLGSADLVGVYGR